MYQLWSFFIAIVLGSVTAYRYDPAYVQWNLNTNVSAIDPLNYAGEWTGHVYTPSPKNWRFPFYTLFLDRFVNGDPTNDDINGTLFERDPKSNQIRYGGDLQGLIDTLDYLQGMGIKGLYVAGSPFLNAPWGYDQYSPLDLTILDHHFGTLTKWREAIDAIHQRGMYVLLDNTFATMGDLIGFEGYLNVSAPFSTKEHQVQWKNSRHYWDFEVGNTYNETCQYPEFWLETGVPVGEDVTSQLVGCYDSDFDQYGDTEAFGVYPDWRRQLTKFASVQDRLREWHEPVRMKLEKFYCILIAQLDVDGFRYDKATQSTVDAMASMNHALRTCARRYGKDNFFTPGEITGGNVFGSIYLGRGRQPDMTPNNLTQAVTLSTNDDEFFIRTVNYSALEAAAFHYTTYRTLTRFLGMDGNLEAGYDAPKNWVDQWNTFLLTNDFLNANNGKFDPRHMFGVTNQDVFRWPAITQGIERQLLGHFITILTMPGIPLLLWGEEQAFNILDNTAPNYIFGRQPIASAQAWKEHGCYSMGSTQYYQMPLESARTACLDEYQSYDRRNPAHPVRNILKRMFQLREEYPVLNDGMYLEQLSNQTYYHTLPGSAGTPTEFGIWSVYRSELWPIQNSSGAGDIPIWLLYSNINETTTYEFECDNNDTGRDIKALIAPFDSGTRVKNLLFPYDEHDLINSSKKLGFNGSIEFNGCLNTLTMPAYGFGAYVPIDSWVGPKPMITSFTPGHDARILSQGEDLPVELHFSTVMDCESVTNSIQFQSTTADGITPSIVNSSVVCSEYNSSDSGPYVGAISGVWSWKANLTNVEDGVHALVVSNPSTIPKEHVSIILSNTTIGNLTNQTYTGMVNGTRWVNSTVRRNDTYFGQNLFAWLNSTNITVTYTKSWTNSTDKFFFRVGHVNNPIVFPSANYSTTLLTQGTDGQLIVNHAATGADYWRYSTNWGSTYSQWIPYTGGNTVIDTLYWSGTHLQQWKGQHVRVEYFSSILGTSDIAQEGDVGFSTTRRFPHLFLNGPYNQYGYDTGLNNEMTLRGNSTWVYHLIDEWLPSGTVAQINVWGMNPDGQPDQSFVYGDVDGDSVLDRLPPSSLAPAILNITSPPVKPHLGWNIVVDDSTLRFRLEPSGNMWLQLTLYVLLWFVPILTGIISVRLFMLSFYQVKFNQVGIVSRVPILSRLFSDKESSGILSILKAKKASFRQSTSNIIGSDKRRTVLIATMEYDIEDWAIKVKIGGLGVMAQLMGKNLSHQDLIWVIPCVGGVQYPIDEVAEPMTVIIMGVKYDVQIQYHKLRNITYVLLDAPVFRRQTVSEPYPPRMDDMSSAIYYSAWNQCIAQAITRFPIDLYHINDYHGSIAPLHLLPNTLPVCLSLHNAEFQGLWPMRSKEESDEVCSVFNLPLNVVQRYVQFGEVFNLLHAGASYLREHQTGFGAVGVSKKYGKRAYARYPIFWGLKNVGQLPNPDPSDTAEYNSKLVRKESDISIDSTFEAGRAELKRQAQEWAGLEQNSNAELFVFVGRWSMQKGIDLIADVFPSILEQHPNTQLITVGPVIDLYGKFAAAKLQKMTEVYPGRVCSKPVFTACPPALFSGAEFALIPSRDEPFGLVAVEFGRKGALGVGARVGGLGQMPGWWYTVESMTTGHLMQQFRTAISEALSSSTKQRALMRARSAKQRFPVAQWVEDLEILQSTSIRIHGKELGRPYTPESTQIPDNDRISAFTTPYGTSTPAGARTPRRTPKFDKHRSLTGLSEKLEQLRNQSENRKLVKRKSATSSAGNGTISLGTRRGPGHIIPQEVHDGDNLSLPQIRHLPSMGEINSSRVVFDLPEDESDDETPFGTNRFALDFMINRLNDFDSDSQTLHSRNDDYVLPQSRREEAYSILSTPKIEKPQYGTISSVRSVSTLSVDLVVGDRTDYKLQQVDPFFTDANEEYFTEFSDKLEGLRGSNSEKTCIEEFITKSTKQWFNDFRDAKLGYTDVQEKPQDEFLLGTDYVPPTGLRRWMQVRVGSWPIYSFLLAFGQIVAANSYQVTLLTGQIGQSANKLYALSSIYLVTSLCWWILYRRFSSAIVLSLPFFFYGMAFVLVGLAHYGDQTWIQNVGTGCYAVASSSGSMFFALNFGDDGGAETSIIMFRACVIQGTQQIYVVALWFWGAYLTRRNTAGLLANNDTISQTWKITAICLPIAVLFWSVGLLLWFGLPGYYRQHPGQIPSFYRSISRRKIVLWFFITVAIQNFFLSAPYGRNWSFLWKSSAPAWQIVLLVILFFIFVWSAMLGIFGWLSKYHTWILPLFAIGLGAPRWAQIWWGTSNIGLYLPWTEYSALVSRALWLWLGTLDAIQGVGFGMILLATLTRVHVAFTLVLAQVIGSVFTILARAFAPNNLGPGMISPDVSETVFTIFTPWFWVGLLANLLICVGFYMFYRKEQLSKP